MAKYAIIKTETTDFFPPVLVAVGPKWKLVLQLREWVRNKPRYAYDAIYSHSKNRAEVWWFSFAFGQKTTRSIVKLGDFDYEELFQ